jgi:hypothetical protein
MEKKVSVYRLRPAVKEAFNREDREEKPEGRKKTDALLRILTLPSP